MTINNIIIITTINQKRFQENHYMTSTLNYSHREEEK